MHIPRPPARRHVCALAISLLFIGLCSARTNWPSGPLLDTKCNVETVELANTHQLSSILNELTDNTFFRLFRVRLDMPCVFWGAGSIGHVEEQCSTPPPLHTGFGLDEAGETACSISKPSKSFSDWLSLPVTDNVDRTISQDEEKHMGVVTPDCEEENLPSFWLDMCNDIPTDASDFLNLKLNPERWTGYNGSHIWKAIYEENCFSHSGKEDMCYEERVLYRLLSGMHAKTNIHINMNYFPPRKVFSHD
jgi:hypothetical protein